MKRATVVMAAGIGAGLAHLAYANARAEGAPFFQLGSGEPEMMRKDSAVPLTMETPAE